MSNDYIKYDTELEQNAHDPLLIYKTYAEVNAQTNEKWQPIYEQVRDWSRQAGRLRIMPMYKEDYIRLTNVAYFKNGLPEPEIQTFPISNVKVTPHQISFDFFDTTEGKIGISKGKEMHMILEFDVYVTDLIYYYWDHWNDEAGGFVSAVTGGGGGGVFTGLRFIQEQAKNVEKMMKGGKCDKFKDGQFNQDAEGYVKWAFSQLNPWSFKVNNFEDTQAFMDFRNTFLQQYTGWVCKFLSQTFGVFEGVITDISYEIEDGYTDAKWHVKVQEAIFSKDYDEGANESRTSNGLVDDSG